MSESGLAPGQSYQLVVQAAGKLGIEKDGEYLQIFTMDEVYSKPYSAIEMGRAQLLRVPIEPAGAADPQFLWPTGMTIINDDNGVVDLEERSLMFELMVPADTEPGIYTACYCNEQESTRLGQIFFLTRIQWQA